MTEHQSFEIDLIIPASPEQIFDVMTDSAKKQKWLFGSGGIEVVSFNSDLRTGGVERVEFRFGDGAVIFAETHYKEVVPCQSIRTVYSMGENGVDDSISHTYLTLTPIGDGTTRLLHQEIIILRSQKTTAEQRADTMRYSYVTLGTMAQNNVL